MKIACVMITVQELEALKKLTCETGGRSREDIMESAGWAIYTIMTQRYPDLGKKKIVAICDGSEEGGYGLVFAHFLDENFVDVKILITEKVLEPSTQAKTERMRKEIMCKDTGEFLEHLEKAYLVIDASKHMDRSLMEKINASSAEIISVEAPSGIDLRKEKIMLPHIDADLILTMHDIKPALETLKEKVVILDLGLADYSVESET